MRSEQEILKDIERISKEFYAKSPSVTGNWDTYDEFLAVEEDLIKQVYEIDKEVGEGVKVGRLIQIPYADGYALYWITKITKSSVHTNWIPYGDAWQSPVVSERGVCPMRIATEYIRMADWRRNLRKS